MKSKLKLINPECIPYKAHKWDAGWDLKSNNETFTIKPGEKVKVHTGIQVGITPRFMGIVVPRSGLGSKFRVTLANVIGVIDSGYTGEIIVNLVNDGKEPKEIKKYDRFCQLIIVPVDTTGFRVVDELGDTERGDGGFGSTENKLSEAEKAGLNSLYLAEMEIEEILDWMEENEEN